MGKELNPAHLLYTWLVFYELTFSEFCGLVLVWFGFVCSSSPVRTDFSLENTGVAAAAPFLLAAKHNVRNPQHFPQTFTQHFPPHCRT